MRNSAYVVFCISMGLANFAYATPPKWNTNLIELSTTDSVHLSAQITKHATDPNPKSLIFKISDGVPWLQMESEGEVYGTPGPGDLGKTAFQIFVSNDMGQTWVGTWANVEVTPNPALVCINGDKATKIGLTPSKDHELFACRLEGGPF